MVAFALIAGALMLARREARDPIRSTLALADALGVGDTAGFLRATEPRDFTFPADHGQHPGYRTEWWYYMGNLDAADGRRLGYQLTFFRSALTHDPVARASAWAANEVYMAHFAVTDGRGKVFAAFDRFERAAVGLAGASGAPVRVWLDDWSAAADRAEADAFPMRLRAREEGVEIDLALERGKPPVLQGDHGLSAKGDAPGDASYYYSLTRMPTTGTVRIGGASYTVSGASWMDREWSTSSLSREQIGWDWFALQLDDGSDLMWFRLRRRDGVADPHDAGVRVDADGNARTLGAGAVDITVTETWRSPLDDTVYPAGWRLELAPDSLDLRIEPLIAAQELNLSVRYWEGAVVVRGTRAGRPVSGRGYVELTGYAGADDGGRLRLGGAPNAEPERSGSR